MKIVQLLLLISITSNLIACSGKAVKILPAKNSNDTSNTNSMKIKITFGSYSFTATVYNNATATAFKTKLPLTINMSELNGNEKYFDLQNNLPANASNPGTVQAGDLMLYGSNTLVLFYRTFSTSYNYTRIARIDNPTGLADALGLGNKTVKFELSE